MHALLEAAAERAPLLLVVEDAHWADQSTREMLSFLFVRAFVAPVVVVVSYRADDLHRRHPLRAQVGEWLRLRGVERLHLEPLEDGTVRELIAQLHPDPMAEDQLDRDHRAVRGQPVLRRGAGGRHGRHRTGGCRTTWSGCCWPGSTGSTSPRGRWSGPPARPVAG